MKLVLEVIEDRANETIDYAVQEIGARSLILTRYAQNLQLTISTRLRATDPFVQHYVIQGGIAAAEISAPVGFNIFEETIRFAYGNPGPNLFKLQFYDEPITPFGWAVARNGNPNIGAGATAVQLTNVNLGAFSLIQVFVSSSQSGLSRLDIHQNGNLVLLSQPTQHPTSNAHETPARPYPNGNVISLEIENLGAGAANFPYNIIGYF